MRRFVAIDDCGNIVAGPAHHPLTGHSRRRPTDLAEDGRRVNTVLVHTVSTTRLAREAMVV